MQSEIQQASFYSVANRTMVSIPTNNLPKSTNIQNHLTVIMLDVSGSMEWPSDCQQGESESNTESRINIAKKFILEQSAHLDYTNLYLIKFASDATAIKIDNCAELKNCIDAISVNGGTNFISAVESLALLLSQESSVYADVTIWNVTDMGMNKEVQSIEQVLTDAVRGTQYIEYFYTQLAQEGTLEETEKIHKSIDKALLLDGKTSSVPFRDSVMVNKLVHSLNPANSYNLVLKVVGESRGSSLQVLAKTAVLRTENERIPIEVEEVSPDKDCRAQFKVRVRSKDNAEEKIDIFFNGTLEEGVILKCSINDEFFRYQLAKDTSLIAQHKLALHNRLMHITGNVIDTYSQDKSSVGNLEARYVDMVRKFCNVISQLEDHSSYCASVMNSIANSLESLLERYGTRKDFLESVFLQLLQGDFLKKFLERAFFPDDIKASTKHISDKIASIIPDVDKLESDRQKLKAYNVKSKIEGTQFAISEVAKMSTRGSGNSHYEDEVLEEVVELFQEVLGGAIETAGGGLSYLELVVTTLDATFLSPEHIELRNKLLSRMSEEFNVEGSSVCESLKTFGINIVISDRQEQLTMINTIHEIFSKNGIKGPKWINDYDFVEALRNTEYKEALDILVAVKNKLFTDCGKTFSTETIEEHLRANAELKIFISLLGELCSENELKGFRNMSAEDFMQDQSIAYKLLNILHSKEQEKQGEIIRIANNLEEKIKADLGTSKEYVRLLEQELESLRACPQPSQKVLKVLAEILVNSGQTQSDSNQGKPLGLPYPIEEVSVPSLEPSDEVPALGSYEVDFSF